MLPGAGGGAGAGIGPNQGYAAVSLHLALSNEVRINSYF
jgi:hypothetical protein